MGTPCLHMTRYSMEMKRNTPRNLFRHLPGPFPAKQNQQIKQCHLKEFVLTIVILAPGACRTQGFTCPG